MTILSNRPFNRRCLHVIFPILTFLIGSHVSAQGNKVDQLIAAKLLIEEKIKSNKSKLIVLVRLKGERKTKIVHNENMPKNVETVFNVLKDQSGQIVYIGEFPISESGEWTLELKHFFNANGRTFAFEEKSIFHNEKCAMGSVVEKLTDYFDEKFNRIGTAKHLRDGKGNAIKDQTKCYNPYHWTIDKKASADELMKVKQIEL